MRYRAAQTGGAPDPDGVTWVALHDISPYLVCAVVRAEDMTFFRHRGFWWSQIRAQIRNALRNRRQVRAVSTITQQLARNLYLHPERSMRRKLQEAVLAWRLERALTKERILELYLNLVEWGPGVWGIGAASRYYFSRTAAEIEPVQAMVLASMLPAPNSALYGRNAQRALAMQNRLTIDLYACGILSSDEADRAKERIAELRRAIDRGVAGDLFRELAIEPTLRDRPDITVRRLVAEDCGWEQTVALKAHLDRFGWPEHCPPLPLWWAGKTE